MSDTVTKARAAPSEAGLPYGPEPFAAILAESGRVGWPQHYRTDLDQDKEILEFYKPRQFGWVLRSHGTFTLLAQDDPIGDSWLNCGAKTAREWSVKFLPAIWAQDHSIKLYWWDGARLRPVSYERLLESLKTFGVEDA